MLITPNLTAAAAFPGLSPLSPTLRPGVADSESAVWPGRASL